MDYEKPLPVLDPESTPFWEATREHKLKIVKCGDAAKSASRRPALPALQLG